jgi:hypothetical protein
LLLLEMNWRRGGTVSVAARFQQAGWLRNDARTRYFFDVRDGDKLIIDEEGMELRDLKAVKEEAARSLEEMVREERGNRRVAIEVRDGAGPVLQVRFTLH